MINYAIYEITTGKIRSYCASYEGDVDMQLSESEEFYINCPMTATHIINNEPVTIIPEVTLEDARKVKKQEIAQTRYSRETMGVVINGIPVDTDDRSKALLTSAYVSLKNGFCASKKWKTKAGWVEMTLTELEPIAIAVDAYVQACFDQEDEYVISIGALTTKEEVESFDTSVWPSNIF